MGYFNFHAGQYFTLTEKNKSVSFHLRPTCASDSRSWVVRREATQFAVAAANHSALGSDEMKSGEVRRDE